MLICKPIRQAQTGKDNTEIVYRLIKYLFLKKQKPIKINSYKILLFQTRMQQTKIKNLYQDFEIAKNYC